MALIGLALFLGLTADYGGLVVVPTLPGAWLQGTPFGDYLIPALWLTIPVGGGALAGAAGLLLRREWGILAAVAAGLAVAVVAVVQVAVLSLDVWLQAIAAALGLPPVPTAGRFPVEGGGLHPALWLEPFYVALGLLMEALTARLWLRPWPAER
jgi:hypothetical protein